MRRLFDFTIRVAVVAALCLGLLGIAQSGWVAATQLAVQASHSAPQTTFFVSNTFDNGAGSLRQAILDANTTPGEDVIHINAIGTVNLLSALPTITEAVTIFVEDAHVLRIFRVNGQNQYRGLNIDGVPVTISGLIVLNGVGTSGGGIRSDGSLTLNAVHVLNSSADLGGGVYATGSVVVNGGRYEGNIANFAGGAMYTENALTVHGSIIQNNHCTTSANCLGGGLYGGSTLIMTNTEIISNTAVGYGGGAYSDGSVVVNGSRYEGNIAGNLGGGAIFAQGALTVNGSLIQNNHCTTSLNCLGGGLSAASTLTMTNTEIISNTAAGGGGGVAAGGAAVITGTLFISNTSADFGGGALFSDLVQITNSRFENNGADGNGGGLFAFSAVTTTLNNVDFVGNNATNQGGGLLAGDVIINGGRFEQNTASLNGGGLYGENAILTDTHFISNTAAHIGGASVRDIVATGGSFEYNTNGLVALGSMVLTGTQFLNNSGDRVAFAADRMQVTNVLFANNSIALESYGEAIIADSQFVNNDRGIEAVGPLTVTNSLFMNNTLSGVAHYIAGDVSIVNTLFAGNSPSGNGTAVSLSGEGTATLKHVTIASSELVTTTAITTSKEFVFIQNTIIADQGIGLNVTTGFVALSHILFHDNALDIQGSVAVEENRVTGEPLFVNPDADNYHLQAGSAAIDAGQDAGITTDFEGDIRPSLNGFDVGFDEVVILNQVNRVMLPIILR